MPIVPRPFPPALPHSELRQILPGLWFVTGTLAMPGPIPMRFSRNMTVVQDGSRLILVNTVRLDERGLAALDALGKVTDVVRLAANHGMDDPFYADRYSAKVWTVRGQRYTAGFDTRSEQTYFTPHLEMEPATELPIAGARLYVIASSPPEGLLVLERHGGVAISGDSLQHWARPDAFFNAPGKLLARMMGFIKPHNIGPRWLKRSNPPKRDLRGVLELPFENVLPSHGEPVLGGARGLYRPAIERLT